MFAAIAGHDYLSSQAVASSVHVSPGQAQSWAACVIEKKPFKLVAVALANKMARISVALCNSVAGMRSPFPGA
jgi:hypothetical protein